MSSQSVSIQKLLLVKAESLELAPTPVELRQMPHTGTVLQYIQPRSVYSHFLPFLIKKATSGECELPLATAYKSGNAYLYPITAPVRLATTL